jgi:PilX N-terminal
MSRPLRQRMSGDEGVALLGALLLTMMVSALGAALVVGASTETLIARNHQNAAEARAAAEAGLNHAIQVTIENLQNWQSQGFASRSAAMTAMLQGPDGQAGAQTTDADNGSLESYGIPRPPARLTLGSGSYEARVLDEDDPGRGFVLSPADRSRISEDGQPHNDANSIIVVRAVGHGSGKTVAIVEAAIARRALPAIVTNQDLLINGSPAVQGTRGSVHSNQDLSLTGSPDIAQDATASGVYTATGHPTIGGISGGDFGIITIPPVRAADYRFRADYILTSDGRIVGADDKTTKAKGKTFCNAQANAKACKNDGWAWTYQPSSGWNLGDNAVPPVATYYVEGSATISGSPGSSNSPVQLSIVAEGDIDIGGGPYIVPKDPEVLFVTDGDLRIAGNATVPTEGAILVREQISISGSPTIAGVLVAEGAASLSDLVTANSISGNPTLISNGIAGFGGFTVSAWRQIR